MEKELAKFAQNKPLQEALMAVFIDELGNAIVSKVMQGENVVGYKEAKEVFQSTLTRIKVEYARSLK